MVISERFGRYFVMASRIASAQVVAQGLGALSGFLLVNTMSKTQLAYFTIAFSVQSVVNVLSETGVSALMAIGGKVWQDTFRMGQLMHTYLYIKRWMAVLTGLAAVPYLAWMLHKNGASAWLIAGILSILATEVSYYLVNTSYTFVYMINSQIRKLQYAQVVSPGVRLLGVGLACLFFTKIIAAGQPGSFTFFNTHFSVNLLVVPALLASLISTVFQHLYLKKTIGQFIDKQVTENNPDDSRHILRLVLTQFPNTLFYCIQGQITVFLITTFGKTDSIADIGALSRVSVLFTVIGAVVNNIALPAFARCQQLTTMKRQYAQIILGYFGIAVVLVVLVGLFPEQILWVLGNKYAHLQKELLLLTISTLIYYTSGAIYSLNTTKAWIKQAWLAIPAVLLTQLALIPFTDFRETEQVLRFHIFSAVPGLLVNLYQSHTGFQNFAEAENLEAAVTESE